MKKKILLYGILGLFLIIQFVPTERPEVIKNNPKDLIVNNDVPENIEKMLRTTCYDCHSNETIYPWYAYVAPISFLVIRDTKEGRRELNFSEWENLDNLEKAEMLEEIAEEVVEGEMPMKIYPITHPNARLSNADRESIVQWTLNSASEF